MSDKLDRSWQRLRDHVEQEVFNLRLSTKETETFKSLMEQDDVESALDLLVEVNENRALVLHNLLDDAIELKKEREKEDNKAGEEVGEKS